MIRRRRWIQPEFFTSEDVISLPIPARLTFIGLWCYADDYGRARLNPALIKADVWPVDTDINADVVLEHILLLNERGMVELYEANGRDYFYLTGWETHQPVDKPARSKIPPPSAIPPCPAPEFECDTPDRVCREEVASEGGEGASLERVATESVERAGASEWETGDARADAESAAPESAAPESAGPERAGLLVGAVASEAAALGRFGGGVGVSGGGAPLGPPEPFCTSHPGGTTSRCKACGNARMAWEHWKSKNSNHQKELTSGRVVVD